MKAHSPLPYILLPFILCPFLACAEVRTWTSTSGSSVQAELESFDGSTVVLLMGTQTVSLEATQLVPEDQLYLREWMIDNPPGEEAAADEEPPAEWPDIVEVPRDGEITVVKEDEAANLFIYRSKHYEFESPVALSKSVMQDLALVFEATYAFLDEIPLKANLRIGDTDPLKVKFVERAEQLADMGWTVGGNTAYVTRTDTVGVPLGDLGGEFKNGRWSFRGQDLQLDSLRLRLANQLLSPARGAPSWFDMGFARYVAEMRYRSGRYLVASHRSAITDFVKSRNSAREFPMRDLEQLLNMKSAEWNGLIAAGNLGDTYPSVVLLAYYFAHLDGEGDGAPLRNYIHALAEGTSDAEARDTYLLRGRSYSDLAMDLKERFGQEGIRIAVQPPRLNLGL